MARRSSAVTERAGSHACGGAVERSETERAKTEAPEQTKRASVHLDRGSCHLLPGMISSSWVLSINGKRYAPLVRLCAVRGTNSDRCQWQKQGAVSGAALRFLQAPAVARRKKRLSARGPAMVTFSDLIQTGILIVGIIGLVLQIIEIERNHRQ